MRYYGLYAVFADETNPAGKINSYVCDITELGWTLNEIYRENAMEVMVVGNGEDERTVRMSLLVAAAEDVAVRGNADAQCLEESDGIVRSLFVSYGRPALPTDRATIISDSLREIVASTMDAVIHGATNFVTTYQGDSVEDAALVVTEYWLRGAGLLEVAA